MFLGTTIVLIFMQLKLCLCVTVSKMPENNSQTIDEVKSAVKQLTGNWIIIFLSDIA